MINYVFPGTFDPITNGHFSLIEKLLEIMNEEDKLIISLSSSQMKKPMLSFDERFRIIQSILSSEYKNYQNILSTEKIIGNTAEFIHKKKAICVRGIRNIDDLRYESYWPVSRSSRNPVDIFLLLPIFDKNSKFISSTYFKKKLNEILNNSKISRHDFYSELKILVSQEVIDLYYKKHFSNNVLGNSKTIKTLNKQQTRNGCIIADYNIIDKGHINFIKNNLNLTDKLTIFIPEIIQHQKISHNVRFELINKTIKNLKKPNIKCIKCKELGGADDILNIIKLNNINQLFMEMREYHTRSDQKVHDAFDIMKKLHNNNIHTIIVLQEKFRDLSQPLIFNIGYDENESKTEIKNSMLKKYIPTTSYKIVMDFVKKQ